MANEDELRIIKEIAQKYGNVIDVQATPFVMAEILRNYGGTFADGGVRPLSVSVQGGQGSSVAQKRPKEDGVDLSDVMRGILQLQRAVSFLDAELKEVLELTRLKK